MRVRPTEAERGAEEPVVQLARRVPRPRAIVARPLDELGPDHHVDAACPQHRDGAAVEIDVAEVDLVAEHEAPARLLDARAERGPVVRLADREVPHFRVLALELASDAEGPVVRAVLGEHELPAPAEGESRSRRSTTAA